VSETNCNQIHIELWDHLLSYKIKSNTIQQIFIEWNSTHKNYYKFEKWYRKTNIYTSKCFKIKKNLIHQWLIN